MTKIYKILPLALLISGVVHAATDNPWYAGARIGGTSYDNFGGALDGDEGSYERDDWGGGVFVGYNYNDWLGVEGGYTYLGQADLKAVAVASKRKGWIWLVSSRGKLRTL
jgi:OOP family OmpA-OmpF porin